MLILPMTLTPNARTVRAQRYLRTDAQGHVVETPEDMVLRAARLLASVEHHYDPHLDVEGQVAQYVTLMAELRFLPNSPTLMNAGRPYGQLAGCIVLPVDDSLYSIFTAVRDAARIHHSGGGVDLDFSRLHPLGDAVQHTGGVAVGPVALCRSSTKPLR